MEHFTTYFNALKAYNLSEITEHSLRPELKTLLTAIAHDVDRQITILHEGKREGKFGAPDFKVTRIENIIGYVENKKIDENLDKILKSDQIKKYQQLSDNILLTNYLEWIWIHKGTTQQATLCTLAEIERKLPTLEPHKVEAVTALLKGFLSFAPEGIGKPKALAGALALRGKLLKEFLAEELQRQAQQDAKGKLFGLYETFQKYVFHELTLAEFADAFSQNLIYGLFLAKLTADTVTITLSNAEEFISANFELIHELVEFLKDLKRKAYTDIRWVIEEVLTIFNTMNFRDIKTALSFTRRFTANDDPYAAKDPYVYFYEDFLAAYDKNLRKAKGVYYTPPQVVNFIVRAADDILKETFHLPDGLADHERVTVLDFAAGTGTFLLEVIQQIFRQYPMKSEQRLLIKEHILKHLYGFEYLIAPYTIAHLKLSQFLKDHDYDLQAGERLQIFLTNTLEPTDRQLNIALLPALTEETKQAQHIKDQPILVIMGNPPYSYVSKNIGSWISNKIKDYYVVDGQKLNEKNPKGLQDDYVKFIRFAQDKMDQVEEGIVAIITNHSFLDNPTFRGMRQSLMTTFHHLYFIDLHGNSKKKEKMPEGGKDENVFDIEQGVAISILVKKQGLEKKVYRADFWGTRENKYKLSLENSLKTIPKTEIKPNSPFYLFQYRDEKTRERYEKGWNVIDIFRENSVGIVTGNNDLFINYSKHELLETIKRYFEESDEEKIQSVITKPFDNRFIYYDHSLLDRSRKAVLRNMFSGNLCMITVRQVAEGIFNHVFVSRHLVECRVMLSNKGYGYVFPLYLYEKPEGLFANGTELIKTENFTKAFRQFIDQHYHTHYPPEEILGYIYAVLHSPTYRAKYAEFLKIDFPRIPFTKDGETFETLSKLGWQLVQAHLLHEIPASDLGAYGGEGDNTVIKPDYRKTPDSERLYINKTQYFEPVPEAVYRFQIGGYQVLDKYLKDRKGRTLTLSEVKNIKQIIKVLAFTIEQMHKIDEISSEWI